MTHVLLTGATGLLGQYVLRNLLLAGTPVAVLVRSRRGEPAERRVEQLFAPWEDALGQPLPRPVCLEGDVSREGLALSTDDGAWVAGHCRSVLHNAASLTFVGQDRAREPWLSNLTRARNVLDLCRGAGVRELHHVSTASVCGQRPGPVLEDEDERPGELRNDYEHSKFEAEQLVRAASFLERTTIYRPAILVGDSRTGYTASYHGLYTYAQFVAVYLACLDRGPDGRYPFPLRLDATGDERRNLVPVDWVSAVIAHVFRHSEHHGRTYHLTPLRPVTAAEIETALSTFFNYYGPSFAGPGSLAWGDLSELERQFYDHVAVYQPYWLAEPLFDCRNTGAAAPHLVCPPIDRDCLLRLLDFAVRDRWGKARRGRRSGAARKAGPVEALGQGGACATQGEQDGRARQGPVGGGLLPCRREPEGEGAGAGDRPGEEERQRCQGNPFPQVNIGPLHENASRTAAPPLTATSSRRLLCL